MPLQQRGQIDQIEAVLREDGTTEAPASAAEQQATNQRLGNHDTLTAIEHATSSTTAEQLPSSTVPDGVAVAVTAHPGNTGTVWVGDADAQTLPIDPGEGTTIRVTNVDAIHVRAVSSGDSVGILHEADN